MGSTLEIMLAVLAVAGVSAYLILRQVHVQRLGTVATDTTSLPPAKVLSWSGASSPQSLERPEYPATSEHIGPPSLPPWLPRGSEAAGGFDARRHTGLGTASLDAILSSLPSLHDLASIDWNVVDGIRLSAASGLDLSRWSDLREYVDSHYFDVGEPHGFLNRLVGYVGEAKAGDFFSSQGAEALFNEAPNVPGYDITVDGSPVQVKVGGTVDTFQTHFDRYPDIPVVTGADNIGVIPDGADVSFIDSLDADQIHAATEESLDVVHDDFDAGGPVVPYITMIRSSLQQIGLLVDGHTDLTTAAKNVGLDATGVGLGGWAGAKVGAMAGSALGPVGTVVGGVLGAIAGAIGGRAFTNQVKYAELRGRVEEYQTAIAAAQKTVQSRQVEAHSLLVAELARQQEELRRYVHVVQAKLKAKLKGCHRWHQNRCITFVKVFPRVLDRVRKALEAREQAELAAIERSGLLRRLLWPRLVDVRYRLVRSSFRRRMRAVASARAEFAGLASKTPSQIPPTEAIGRIDRFVQGSPFESADFDNVCHQLKQATDSIRKQEERLKQQASELAKAEYRKRLTAMRARFQNVAREVSVFVTGQAEAVAGAKDRVLREARKLGVDLQGQQ